MMNGDIGVISTLGEGSTFWFEIPLPVAEIVSETDNKPASDTVDIDTNKNFKILVAEDNPANQLLIRTLMEKLGQDVTIVENGQLAVDALSVHSFDLVFMDMQMPVMDGYTATKQIRDSGNNIPIIALTAHVIKDEESKFRAAGMNDWLSKPFNVTDLVKKLYYWGQFEPKKEDVSADQKSG